AVASYLDQMAKLQAGQPIDDPNAFAQKILGAALGGDESAFPKLARTIEEMEAKAKAVRPPAACAALHRAQLALLSDSRGLVGKLESALLAHDADALSNISSSATVLTK